MQWLKKLKKDGLSLRMTFLLMLVVSLVSELLTNVQSIFGLY